jgi:PST family polysaccharide transporter
MPIIFGRKWPPAISVLISAYLSAIPSPFLSATSRALRALRALDKHNWDLRWIFLFTIYFAIAFPAGASWNFTGAALAILIAHVAAPSIHALWARKYISKSMQSKAVGQHG